MNAGRACSAAAAIVLASCTLGASCGQTSLGVLPGVVNDPHNLSLRRAILAWGTTRLCAEAQRRSVPLKMREEDPVTGRFYPHTCFATGLANKNLFVQFAGRGYVFNTITRRIGFEAGGAVEYDHDFLMDGSTMYVYFRQRSTSATSFNIGLIEQPNAALAAGLAAAGQGAEAAFSPQSFGEQLMKSEIARGFTVIRDDDGTVEFGLGLVERGRRPPSPYRRPYGARQTLANERTEVHQNQRDFAGPFQVEDGEMLHLTVSVDGAAGIDVQVVARGLGEAWLQSYTLQAAAGPPPGPPALDEPVVAGAIWRRSVELPEGAYYVVFDNTATAGRTHPPAIAQDDRAALVSFALEVGD